MSAPYVLSAFQNTSGNFSDYFALANAVSGGVFGGLAVLAFFLVLFVSMKQYGTKQALGASSVLTMIFALFGRMAHIVLDWHLMIVAVMTGVAVVYAYLSDKPDN